MSALDTHLFTLVYLLNKILADDSDARVQFLSSLSCDPVCSVSPELFGNDPSHQVGMALTFLVRSYQQGHACALSAAVRAARAIVHKTQREWVLSFIKASPCKELFNLELPPSEQRPPPPPCLPGPAASISTPSAPPPPPPPPPPTPTSSSTTMLDSLLCVVCMDARRCYVLTPCRHYCACATCAPKLAKCPLCRKAIRERMRVFDS